MLQRIAQNLAVGLFLTGIRLGVPDLMRDQRARAYEPGMSLRDMPAKRPLSPRFLLRFFRARRVPGSPLRIGGARTSSPIISKARGGRGGGVDRWPGSAQVSCARTAAGKGQSGSVSMRMSPGQLVASISPKPAPMRSTCRSVRLAGTSGLVAIGVPFSQAVRAVPRDPNQQQQAQQDHCPPFYVDV